MSLVVQLLQHGESGYIRDSDLDAFLKKPHLWREPFLPLPFTLKDAQRFWQDLYNDVGVDVNVPALPRLTDKQVKRAVDSFGFMPVYFAWKERRESRWVLVEQLDLTEAVQSPAEEDDPLMAAAQHLRLGVRIEELRNGLLEKISRLLGFPRLRTRLPTVPELLSLSIWFRRLNELRGWHLPDLSEESVWCQEGVITRGGCGEAGTTNPSIAYDSSSTCFRVLVEL